jgi:hypothetical protein
VAVKGEFLFLLIFAGLLFSGAAFAEQSHSLLRSPEALAMGGAYTAIVEDRDAAFYNPAGVAAYDHLSIHYVDLDPTVSNWVISGWKTLQNLKNPSGASLNQLMGQNIYVQSTASAAILAPGFALIGLYDVQGALYAKNQAFPKIEYGYQTTRGVQAAFGYSVKDGRARGHGRHNSDYLSEWRFGVGAKLLTRTGGYHDERFLADRRDRHGLRRRPRGPADSAFECEHDRVLGRFVLKRRRCDLRTWRESSARRFIERARAEVQAGDRWHYTRVRYAAAESVGKLREEAKRGR